MKQAIGFDELRWMLDLNSPMRKKAVLDLIGERLLKRGLIERKADGFALTARGRIALAKLS